MVIAHRKRIIEDTDGADSDQNAVAADMDDEELKARLLAKGPSSEALSKMTDYGARRSFSPDAKSGWAHQLADRMAARGYFQRYPTSAMSKQTQRRRTRS